MYIVLVIREFWPLKGGLTAHALRLGQELKSRGHEFEVVTPFTLERPGGNDRFWKTERPRTFENEGLTTHVIGLNPLERAFLLPLKKLRWRDSTVELSKKMLNSVYVKRFLKLFKNADVVHYDGAGVEFMGFAAEAAARKLGKPFIIQPSIHIGQWGHLPIDHEFFRMADHLLVHSEIEKDYLINEVNLATEKVTVVYNGIDDRPCKKVENSLSDQSGGKVLFIGRKSVDKGYPLLLEAFQIVRKQLPNAELLVIGPDDGLDVSRYSMDGVTDLGYVDEQTKWRTLDLCQVFCVPSEGESFGLVFLEAGRARKPVIARDLELFDDLLGENGVTGVRVGHRKHDGVVAITPEQIAQALIEMLSDPQKCRSMGEAGLRNAERFLWPNVVKRFEAAYESVLENSNLQRAMS